MVLQLPAQAVFWTRADQGRWKTLTEVLLPDKHCQNSADLTAYLQKAGFPVADMPPHIVEAALERCPGAACITPSDLRKPAAMEKLQTFVSQCLDAERSKVHVALPP